MRSVARVLIGLTVACLTAAAIKVGHVITPPELAVLTGDALAQRLMRFGELTLLTATHQSLFIVPLALIAMLVTEVNRLRGWFTYALLGVAIAMAGFCVQVVGEGDLRTIVNDYAVRAYIIEGLFAGLAYWFVAGRYAGWRRGGALVRARPRPITATRASVSDIVQAENQDETTSETMRTPSRPTTFRP